MRHTWMLVVLVSLLGAAGCGADDVKVSTSAQLRAALGDATAGTRILLAPGEYEGGMWVRDIDGDPDRPIVIAGADPDDPPHIVGGANSFHLANVSYIELRDLTVSGCTSNGINIDDGGSFETPAHHITIANVSVDDVGPSGNRDGIKISGVDEFRIENCTITRWGDGGSAIDMVGCHKGVIEGCFFQGRDGTGGTGVQCKGGTTEIVVRKNLFEAAGGRAINIGGSTGLQFFRPKVDGYEAKDITVEGNVFVGGMAPLAFVGVDGALVRQNTIYIPDKWALRILQETREPGFVPSRNGVMEDNIIVFRSDQWSEGGCNIGSGTAPETFRFEGNVWYCVDRSERSRPALPSDEVDGVYGEDPMMVDPENGEYELQEGSPAEGKGHTAVGE